MRHCSFYQKANQYRDMAASKLDDARAYAAVGYDAAHSRISSLLNSFVLSEVFVLKMMLISFGILIGTMFCDFFKKHRGIIFVAFIASVALFIYKAFQLVDELEDDF
ncbi:MAG: hypothetical protein Q4D42_06960 [Eubacteriales bacterium]|nr:hypothetical protein [Eubacteriales bacterium]